MKRYIYIFLGCVCVCLGSLGIFLPILPTTPFLLLASWFFYRSSDELRDWLLNHKVLGVYIKNYIEHKAIPLRGKIVSIFTLWATILLSVFLFIDNLHIEIFLILVAIGVTIHLLKMKTLK